MLIIVYIMPEQPIIFRCGKQVVVFSNTFFTIDYCVDGDSTDYKRLLCRAASKGCTEVVTALLSLKVDVNLKDKYGYTALMWAADKGHTEIVQLLLDVDGIDVNLQDKYYGYTALMWAAKKGHEEIVTKLLGVEGIDVNLKDKKGYTVFKNDHKEIVKAIKGLLTIDCRERATEVRDSLMVIDGMPKDVAKIVVKYGCTVFCQDPEINNAIDKEITEVFSGPFRR